MDRREAERKKRRVQCQIRTQDRSFSGIILDLSTKGIFVQTIATPEIGEQVELSIPAYGSFPDVTLTATVARRRHVPAKLARLVTRGLGLLIPEASQEYQILLQRMQEPKPPDPPMVSQRRFRVRVAQTSSPRSRLVTVECASAEDAKTQALEELGPDWHVVDVESL